MTAPSAALPRTPGDSWHVRPPAGKGADLGVVEGLAGEGRVLNARRSRSGVRRRDAVGLPGTSPSSAILWGRSDHAEEVRGRVDVGEVLDGAEVVAQGVQDRAGFGGGWGADGYAE